MAGTLENVKHLEAALNVIPLGVESAEVFAMLKADLEKVGTPLADFEMILPACPLAHGLTLVANNVKQFKRIKRLQIKSWTREML